MKSWTKVKFFPFSAGIPWTLKNSRYVIPKLDKSIWDRVVSDKDLVVACYGGLIESFFSLSYIEAFKKNFPNKSVSWLGSPEFYNLINIQDLATPSNLEITKTDLENYPVPLFFTKKDHAIFNSLNNYLIKQTYYKKKNFRRHELIFKQLANNLLIDWDTRYTPKLRNLSITNNFNFKQKYILICSNDINSLHNVNCLDWDARNIRELAALVSQLGYKIVVVCGDDSLRKYFGHTNLITISQKNLNDVVLFIKNANIILSKTIDFLLLGGLISKGQVFCKELPKQLNIAKNCAFCGIEADIYNINDNFSPMDMYNFLRTNNERFMLFNDGDV